jgi:hypothetical protein
MWNAIYKFSHDVQGEVPGGFHPTKSTLEISGLIV